MRTIDWRKLGKTSQQAMDMINNFETVKKYSQLTDKEKESGVAAVFRVKQ